MSLPSLFNILDSYLNTGDYDDALDGWVEVRETDDNEYEIKFTREVDEDGETISYCYLIRHEASYD